MKRSFFAVLTLAGLTACGGAPAATTPDNLGSAPASSARRASSDVEATVAIEEGRRAPTSRELQVIRALSGIAERVRGLTLREPVDVEVHSRARMTAHLVEGLEEEELSVAKKVYVALGLLPEDVNLKDLLERVLGEQVVGYYDPKTKKLVVRDDVMQDLTRSVGNQDEARVVLVHEIVHALQDQRLTLGDVYDLERDSDADTAFRAVVEGDATLAMLAYAVERQGAGLEMITQDPSALATLMENSSGGFGGELSSAPLILKESLVAPYSRGLVFNATLYRDGGWGRIDEAHRTPPVSTEQILHPERYSRGELPDEIVLPRFTTLDAGFQEIDEDTLGEIELAVFLGVRRNAAPTVHRTAAEGWSGDRLRVYEGPRGPVCIWFTAWDNDAEAAEAYQAVLAGLPAPADPLDVNQAAHVGRGVLITLNLPRTASAEVDATFRAFAQALPPEPPRVAAPAVSPP